MRWLRNTRYRIKLLLAWLPVLWNDYDWDHDFIFPILKLKLDRMLAQLTRDGEFVAWEKSDLKSLSICIKLLTRLCDESYYSNKFERFRVFRYEDNLKMSFRDVHHSTNSRLIREHLVGDEWVESKELDSLYYQELRRLGELEDAAKVRDQKLLYAIMLKYKGHWWS